MFTSVPPTAVAPVLRLIEPLSDALRERWTSAGEPAHVTQAVLAELRHHPRAEVVLEAGELLNEWITDQGNATLAERRVLESLQEALMSVSACEPMRCCV